MSDSLQARFLSRLERAPDRRALAFYRRRGDVEWLSRRQLYERAGGVAERLAERGLGVDDVCLVVLPSDGEVPIVALGALLLGAVPLLAAPPTFWKGARELSGFLDRLALQSGAKLVIGSPAGSDEATTSGPGARPVRVEELLAPGSRRPGRELDARPGELVAMQMTSGTTGMPRICVWRQAEVLAALDGMSAVLGSSDEDACFNWTPLYHDLGLVNCFFYCLTRGIPLIMMSPVAFVREPALWLQGMSDTQATTTWSPNFGYSLAARRVRDAELEGVRLDHVTGFWNAAERVHLSTLKSFHRRFSRLGVSPRALRASYGCAENVGGATFSAPREAPLVERVDRRLLWKRHRAHVVDPVDGAESPEVESIAGVGSSHPGVEIEILDPDGNSLGEGEVGEIHLRTTSRMKEYLGQPQATESAFRGSLLRTGDLGYLRGGELYWVGRVRERISLRGMKLDPSVFEEILLGIDGLREGAFAAFGVDDPELGTQLLILVSEVREAALPRAAELVVEVRRRVFAQLEAQVSDVVLLPEGSLRKTSSGKRRNRRCRELYERHGFADLRVGGEAHV
jgi:acyl-CoA synthetase (AMP-forming)/AMP-acid ligase II